MDDQVERLLASKPAPMAELATAAYELLLELFPEAVVTVDGGDVGFGGDSGYKGLIFVLSPHREHVTLGIADGAALPDPDGILEGSGKRHRHAKLRSREDLDDSRLRLLLSAALLKRD
ncbi:MAG: DUF1801 domain-containing protein [Stackebrandtia sp.]